MTNNRDLDVKFGYAVSGLVAAGGLAGFLKARSVPSLVAGVASGAAMAYGVSRTVHNPQDVYTVCGVSGVLTVLMGRRFAAGRKFMPAGLVTILSAAVLARFGSRLA